MGRGEGGSIHMYRGDEGGGGIQTGRYIQRAV